MKLEEQVCSLELAKKLKELGVKQLDNSLWAWAEVAQHEKDEHGRLKWKYEIVANDFQADLEFVAAFSVAELGEFIRQANLADLIFTTDGSTYEWRVWLADAASDDFPFTFEPSFVEKSEADARAKMLVYLLESNLVQVTVVPAR